MLLRMPQRNCCCGEKEQPQTSIALKRNGEECTGVLLYSITASVPLLPVVYRFEGQSGFCVLKPGKLKRINGRSETTIDIIQDNHFNLLLCICRSLPKNQAALLFVPVVKLIDSCWCKLPTQPPTPYRSDTPSYICPSFFK
jgi:hypothetical protein